MQSPGFENYKPINTGYYYNSSVSQSVPQTEFQAPPAPKVMTADQVIQQVNANAIRIIGYNLPVIPPTDPAELHDFTINGYNRSLQNERQKEITAILNEAHTDNSTRKFNPAYFQSPEFAALTKPYYDAMNYLKAMVQGKIPLSLKNAYYKMEAVYGKAYLSYNEYSNIIKQSVDFIKKWLLQNGYSLKDQNALHMGIRKFLNNKLTIKVYKPDAKEPVSELKHLPFKYDYTDYRGEQDHRNYFITKCLATGTGQCSSLPACYLVLAEALGAKAWLTLTPFHSFVKYLNNEGKICNYEPTANRDIEDKWYMDHLGVSFRAKQSGIYLDTMNAKMIVADCMIQMAYGYMLKYGSGDKKFIPASLNFVLKQTESRPMLGTYALLSDYYMIELDNLLYQKGTKDLTEINKIPRAKELHDAYIETENYITKLGYQGMPAAMYENLIQQMDEKGTVQKQGNFNTKKKRNLFIQSNLTH